MVEDARRNLPLVGRQRLDRPLEVIRDDLPRAAERVERLRAQRRRPGSPLDVPEPLHDELEIRRLDPARRPVLLDDAEPARPELDPARADAVEDPLDEHVLGDHVFTLQRTPALQGSDDRRSPGGAVEPVEAEHVAEQVRDPPFEAVEPRERVLAQRKEHVHAQRAVHELGECTLEAARVAVVREVLLRLVEDQVDVARGLRPLGDVEQLAALDDGRPGERGREPVLGVVAPAREDDDDRLLGQLAHRARDGGEQQRRLAHPARPVEHGEAGRDEVRDDDLGIALAPEEIERVELGVLERRKPAIRGLDVHATPSRRRASSPT